MRDVDFSELSSSLTKKNGIWFARSQAVVSYPGRGHEECFQIEDKSFWFRHRNNCIMNVLQNYPPGGLLYDIGGGNGYVSYMLQKNGFEVVLIEPGISGAMNAKKRGVSNIICSTLEEAHFQPGTLPAIGAFDVIEHVKDDRLMFKNFHDHLQIDGRLYMTVPAFKILWSYEDERAGHFKRYQLGSICKLLKEIGFRINYATYMFSVLPVPVFIFRSLPGIIGFERKYSLEKTAKEHNQDKRLFSGLLNRVWDRELKIIKKGRRISIGSSCLIVAEK